MQADHAPREGRREQQCAPSPSGVYEDAPGDTLQRELPVHCVNTTKEKYLEPAWSRLCFEMSAAGQRSDRLPTMQALNF